jgi:2,5-diamino-6-(5-phosphoribosylamino)pyrimidin-4(3H)-one reductase (EC 1.1.1.-)
MHVLLNAAMSLDGKLSTVQRTQVQLSGEGDFDRLEAIRIGVDAVAVGVGTVLADDPGLVVPETALPTGGTQPTRVVFDSRARTPVDAAVLDDRATSIVVCTTAAPAGRVEALRTAGARVIETAGDRVRIEPALAALEDVGIDRVLIEGGGELIFSAIAAGVVDAVSLYIAPVVIGGADAPTLADGQGFTEAFPRFEVENIHRLDTGVVLYLTPQQNH